MKKIIFIPIIIVVLIISILIVIFINKTPTNVENTNNPELNNQQQEASNVNNSTKTENTTKEDKIDQLIKSANDNNLDGYNIINFGVCNYSQDSIAKDIKNTVICNLYLKSDTVVLGNYLTEEGKAKAIPMYQDQSMETLTTANYISEKDVISELYIGNWLARVYSNVFNDTKSDIAKLDNTEMNKMSFIDAKKIYYNKLSEKSNSFFYETIDATDDTLVIRIKDTNNKTDSIYVDKDLGNGCHFELYINDFYDYTTNTYSNYASCSEDELKLLGKKVSENITVTRLENVGLSDYWIKRFSK